MSTTIHASTSMSTDKVNTVEPVLGARPPIAPAAFRRRRRAAQLLMGAVIAIGATLGVVAPRADAMIIGNPVYSSPNNFTAEVHCSRGLLQITARTSVQSGYVNGQYVIWQYHLRNPRATPSTRPGRASTPSPTTTMPSSRSALPPVVR